jgi:hypothetical protein
LPLLSEEDVVLFALSSPNVKGGVFSDLVFATDENGDHLTNSVIFGDPCALCLKTAHPEQCTHKSDLLASWKNPERMAYLAKLYKAIHREDVYKSELSAMGNVIEATIFPRDMYIGFLTDPPFETNERIDAVYIGIDPAYRGKCECAAVAIGQVTHGEKIGFQVRFIFFLQKKTKTPPSNFLFHYLSLCVCVLCVHVKDICCFCFLLLHTIFIGGYRLPDRDSRLIPSLLEEIPKERNGANR